jgi:hypothetical protein
MMPFKLTSKWFPVSLLTLLFSGGGFAGAAFSATTTDATQSRFACQFINGQHTVMYLPQSQPNLAFPWAIPQALGGGWSPERRCSEIGRRLELYRPDGLIELQTSRENNLDIVCVTTQRTPGCRIVFTVPPGQDPVMTRDRVFQNLATADSGQQTQGVATFNSRNQRWGGLGNLLQDLGLTRRQRGQKDTSTSTAPTGSGIEAILRPSAYSASSIDLRPFLDPADGGTGAKLSNGIPRK